MPVIYADALSNERACLRTGDGGGEDRRVRPARHSEAGEPGDDGRRAGAHVS